ncbi:MAG: hypothetical protein M1816_003530 [Peltula sp. TS41687]|nr:MAG: hypothetical protein M1816_003530 [Peltula sp. TS41687]
MPRGRSSTQQPGRGSRAPRGTRQPMPVGGQSRRDDRRPSATIPPPFSTVAPPGHGMPQPGEGEYDDYDDYDDYEEGYSEYGNGEGLSYAPNGMGPASASTSDRGRGYAPGPSRTSLSTFGRGRGYAPGPSRPGHPTPRTAVPGRMLTLPEDGGRTGTSVRRATTIAPTRATAIDVHDHGVFEASDEEEGGTVQPSAFAGVGMPAGRSTIGNNTRMPGGPAPRSQAPVTMAPTGRTTPRTQAPATMAPTRRPAASNAAGTTAPGHARSQRPTQFGRGTARPSGRTQAGRPGNLGAVNEEEEEEGVGDGPELEARTIRAEVQWFDPRHPPLPKPRGYQDENLVYVLEGDDYETYRYMLPSEREDGGLSILQQIDRRAQHLRDPHFSALELWMRAQDSGFLKKIVDNDRGYSYWTIENHNYDIAWACAEQGWWILGVGVGKDKGNFFMEQKEGRF